MSDVFLQVANTSITAGWAVLLVLALRLVLRKAPKTAVCVLWALVGVRVLLPVSWKASFSVMPHSQSITPPGYTAGAAVDSGIPVIDQTLQPLLPPANSAGLGTASPWEWAGWIWLIGVVVLICYGVISYIRVGWQVRISAPAGKGIRVCDEVESPFIFGLLRPVIYLPSGLSGTEASCIVAHEQAHLKRRDHWWKPLAFILLAVHWFNPLMWAAYLLLCRDIEQACDEHVLRGMDSDAVQQYAQTLLRCSIPRRTLAVCPLAFGETNVRSRIQNVLNYKKPAFWVIMTAVVLCGVFAVMLLTEPMETEPEWGMEEVISAAIRDNFADAHTIRERAFEAHRFLGIETKEDRTRVYLAVLYREYDVEGGAAVMSRSVMTPMTVTLTRSSKTSGYYAVESCQSAEKGETAWAAVRRLFPWSLWLQGVPQYYQQTLSASCDQQAEEYTDRLAGVDAEGATMEAFYIWEWYYISLKSDGSFTAVFDPNIGYFDAYRQEIIGEVQYSGTYRRLNHTVQFTPDHGKPSFTAGLTEKGLIFNPQKYGPVPAAELAVQNGATTADVVFRPITIVPPEPKPHFNVEPFLSVAHDMDGDGKTEQVALHHHAGDIGVANVWLRVTQGDVEEFCGAFYTNGMCRSMRVENGGVFIQMELAGSCDGPEDRTPTYEVQYENGRYELYNGTVKLAHYVPEEDTVRP